jgi:hypothetical protein
VVPKVSISNFPRNDQLMIVDQYTFLSEEWAGGWVRMGPAGIGAMTRPWSATQRGRRDKYYLVSERPHVL